MPSAAQAPRAGCTPEPTSSLSQGGIGDAEAALVDLFFRGEFERKRREFLRSEATALATAAPPPLKRSELRCIWWINLARRPDRRSQAEAALVEAGLWALAERVEGIDGRTLDMDKVGPDVATREAVLQAACPPKHVVGMSLTRGALGLLLTWKGLLDRTMVELSAHECALIAEDDACYAPLFQEALMEVMEELDQYDPRWEAAQVGYYPNTSKLIALDPVGGAPAPTKIGQPLLSFGCVGVLVRAWGATRLHDVLFPVREGQQLDTAFNEHYGHLRVYASMVPLVGAVPSEFGDTDIQILGDEAEQRRLSEENRRNISAALARRGAPEAGQSTPIESRRLPWVFEAVD